MDWKRLRSLVSGWISVRDPEWMGSRVWRRLLVVGVGCVLIAGWHGMFVRDAGSLDLGVRYQSMPGGQGIFTDRIKPFFYFFHYTGYFPISWRGDPDALVEREDRARVLIEPRQIRRPMLVNEVGTAFRKGDLAQIFLLYPDYWVNGRAAEATARTFNRWFALVAPLALFVSLSLCRRTLLAVSLVMAIGSNPFQLIHLYVKDNVWGYPILVASVALALSAPLIFSRKPSRWHLVIPCVAGVLLACVREVRTEPALVIASVALCCVTAPGVWRRRAVLVGLLVITYLGTAQAWSGYWQGRVEEAIRVVEAAGGRSFRGKWNQHHSLWHPLWFGLGDFAKDKGYFPDDKVAYRYAIPILNERHGWDYKYGGWMLKNRDEFGHAIKLETVPEYQAVLRDKILSDIRESPGWYVGILLKRTRRIFERALPVRLALGAHYVQIPFVAWIALPMLGLLLWLRQWDQLKLLVFYTPTSLPPLLIYSGWGFTNPTAFHLMAFTLLVSWATLAALRAFARRQSPPGVSP